MRRILSRRPVPFVAAALLALSPAVVIAQPAARGSAHEMQSADSLLTAALGVAASGDTLQALELLEKANKKAPKNPDVLYWRGTMLARTTFLRGNDIPRNILAWKLLERGYELDPKNARYAIEMGRIRLNTPIMRLEAERQFRRALKIAEASGDPKQIAEAAHEIGMIKERRYLTTRDRYMVTGAGMAFDPRKALMYLHYTREFIEQQSRPISDDMGETERSEAEELYRRGLAALPTHEPNAMGMMGLLYDKKRYNEMIEIARPFLADGSGSPRIRLAAGLAAYKLGHAAEADKLFKDALSRFSPSDREELVNLSRILKRNDARQYATLSDSSRINTDNAYWEAADPLLATPENEAWLEFMARNAFSDLRYTDADMRQVGWRTDRGLIIARYGEPPVVAAYPPSGSFDQQDAMGRVITIWYWPESEMHFVFTGPPAMNVAGFAGNFRAYAEETRDEVPFQLKNLPIAANLDTVPMQVARFRGRNPRDVTLVVAADANPQRLYAGAEIDKGSLAMSLHLGAPSQLRMIHTDTLAVNMPAPTTAQQVWIKEVQPGMTRVRVEAYDASVARAAGRAQLDIETHEVLPGMLVLSDPLIVSKTQAPSDPIRNIESASIRPRGNVTMHQKEQFSIYWENYGLVPDANGRVAFDVNIVVRLLEIEREDKERNAVMNQIALVLGNINDAVGLSPVGDQQLGYKYSAQEALGDRDRVPQIQTLGLGSAPPGRYRIEMTVTDKNSKQTAHSERTFYVGRK